MSKFEILKMQVECWFWDFMDALFSGNYKENRRQSKNIISIVKKADEILKKRKSTPE